MSTVIQQRGGTTAEHATFIGANREITVDTTKKTLVVHDGITAGGFTLAKVTDLNTISNGKVDKIAGKGLSTEDYSAADKAKLSNIAAGAQVNVATDLGLGTVTDTTIPITSSTGNDITLPAATISTAGLLTASDKAKLNAIGTIAEFEASLL